MIKTGINIETVKLSNSKLQSILNHSLSSHLNKFILTGILLNPTSKKAIIARTVVIATFKHAIKCAPETPTFLPKKPVTIELNKGNIMIVKYIIYILLQYFLLIYRKQLEYLNLLQIQHLPQLLYK